MCDVLSLSSQLEYVAIESGRIKMSDSIGLQLYGIVETCPIKGMN